MGGGSSDAASVLLALNRLWGVNLPRATLERIGLALGADVPFLLGGEPALARGIGERLTPVTLPTLWVAVIAPPIAVPTAAIFAAPELTRNAASAKMEVFSEGYGRNDLQAVAVARFPAIAEALGILRHRSASARMTGSGGCVFAPFAPKPMREPRSTRARRRCGDLSQGRSRGIRWRLCVMRDSDRAQDERSGRARRFLRWGVAKLVKAPDFDSGIRGFESFLPSHLQSVYTGHIGNGSYRRHG